MERKRSMWKRLLSLTLALAMVLAMAPAYTATAATTAPKTLYLKPNSNWIKDGARFAAYFFGNGEKWVSMTDSNNDGIYEVAVPLGYPNVIFCRMNGGASANNWNNKWNQTGDLTVPSNGNNLFTIPSGSWDGATATWSTHTFDVTLGGSNVTSSGAASAAGGYPYTATLTAGAGYDLPNSITVTMGGAATTNFTYNSSTGALEIPNVTGDIVITAVGVKQASYLYLKPNSNWTKDGARFAAYFFGNGEKWVNMTDSNGDGIYEVELQEGYPNVIFCRMNPSATANNWSNKWNQTGDLTVPSNGNNLFTIPDGSWDGTTTTWSAYPPDGDGDSDSETTETITVYFRNDWKWSTVKVYYWGSTTGTNPQWPGLAMTLVENIYAESPSGDGNYDVYSIEIPADITGLLFNNGSDSAKTPDITGSAIANGQGYFIYWNGSGNAYDTFTYAPAGGGEGGGETPQPPAPEATYIIAGSSTAVFGTGWDTTNQANKMALNAETGLYEKTYASVPVGAIQFKVTDGSWDYSWPNENYNYAVDAISNVTITFNANTKEITVTAEPTGEVAEPVNNVTIHFRNTGLWGAVHYHVWREGNPDVDLTSWPGNSANFNSNETVENWFTVTLSDLNAPNGIGIIFNNGNNGEQTSDISITKDGEYWYDAFNGGLLTAAPENSWPNGGVQHVKYAVKLHFANLKNWGGVNLYTWNAAGLPTGPWPGSTVGLDESGFYSLDFTYEAPEGQNLNFIFSGSGSQTVDLTLPFSAFTKDEDGTYWAENWVAPTSTASEGKYYADIASSADAIALPPVVNGNTVTIQYKGSVSDTVELFGTMNNWSPGYTAAKNEHGVFTFTLDDLPVGIHRYKLFINGSWVLDPLNSWIYAENDDTQNSAFLISNPEADTNRVSIKIHYAAPSSEWNVSAWGANGLAPQYDFENGIATIVLDGRDAQYVCFKIRKSIAGNKWAEQSGEMRVDLANIVSGTIDVWVAGDHSSSQTMDADVVITNKINSVELDYDNNAIIIHTYKAVADPETAFAIYKNGALADIVAGITASGSTYTLILDQDLKLVDLHQYTVRFSEQAKFTDYDYSIGINTVYASDKFAAEFTYEGSDLGATWTENETVFRVWAPTAATVHLNLYLSGTPGENAPYFDNYADGISMTKDVNGTWIAIVSNENLNGAYYTYTVNVAGQDVEAVDPYARTTGINGERGMVIDLESTNPEGWAEDSNPNPSTSYTDAIIYELHVRDFSIDSSSGIISDYRGKFLAFTQEGSTVNGEGNYATGIDYLKNLGITHVHLLPVYDYGSVDETKCENFNWGYDPVNYNVPEGSYSTNPYLAEVRVAEFKQMVKALHDAGISVIMDVVYNHVYDAGKFCFNQIVPGYFSRFNADGSYSNGSGCGNDTASEREMVRKYIVESVNYWSDEYHIDGFRFDLVGLIDATTINQIVDTVHEDRPDTIFYGEGWTMGTAVEPGNEMATQGNSALTPGFAYFSDTIRNLLAGTNGSSLGFVSGQTGQEEQLANNFMARPWWSSNPTQIVQYASCHDNYTLIDKLILSTGKSRIDADIIKMNNLAAAIYMTSQGIPFIHAGEEMLREKLEEDGGRCENSYNASDYVNSIKWSKLNDATCRANVEYYRGLIELRKTHQALRLDTRAAIDANVAYRWITNEVVMFTINASAVSDISDKIIVIFNATNASANVSLPSGTWKICVNSTAAGTDVLSTTTGSVSVAGRSAMVLVQGAAKLVTVTLQDGETVSTITQKDNGVAQLPEDPEKEGYTFLGWFDAEGNRFTGAMPAADTVYTAKWEANDITLTFNVMEYDVLTVTKKAGSAYEFEAAEPTKIGHNFAGWFDADGNEYVGIVPTVDTTYYASWEALSYDLTLNAGPGGEVEISNNKPDCGDTVTITVTPDEGKLLHSIAATANGAEVKLIANPDGTYSFTQPAGEVTVTVTFRDDIPSGSDEQPEDNTPEGGEAPVLPQPEAPDWEDLREPVADLGDSFVQVVQMAVNILQMLFQVPLRLLGFLGSLIH